MDPVQTNFNLVSYLADVRTLILVAATVLDLIFGAIGHSKQTRFDPEAFGSWFQTNILHLVLPYAAVLAAVVEGLPHAINATRSTADIVGWLLLVPAIVKVAASILDNLRRMTAPTGARPT